METPRESLKPGGGEVRAARRRLGLKAELTLAAVPTAAILIVFALVEALTEQRLLFASLASSAFLIYLDPEHGTNSVRTLTVAQMAAAILGYVAFALLGPGYAAGAVAMTSLIVLMVLADVVHPPAVATALSFAFRSGDASNLALFGLAVGITATLVVLEQVALWMLARLSKAHR